MTTYYISMKTWDNLDAIIIDEATLEAAEHGLNYLNPDDFTFLCEADSMEQAKEIWAKEWNQMVGDRLMEANHP